MNESEYWNEQAEKHPDNVFIQGHAEAVGNPKRKLFTWRELQEAMQFAYQGGQALYIMPGKFADKRKDCPEPLQGQPFIAHLFDQQTTRLEATARELGLATILIEKQGERQQHIALSGEPLNKAIGRFRQHNQPLLPL